MRTLHANTETSFCSGMNFKMISCASDAAWVFTSLKLSYKNVAISALIKSTDVLWRTKMFVLCRGTSVCSRWVYLWHLHSLLQQPAHLRQCMRWWSRLIIVQQRLNQVAPSLINVCSLLTLRMFLHDLQWIPLQPSAVQYFRWFVRQLENSKQACESTQAIYMQRLQRSEI